jgi:hypothetical protein
MQWDNKKYKVTYDVVRAVGDEVLVDGDPLAVGEQTEEGINEGQNAAGLLGGGDESQLGGVVHGGELGHSQPGADGVQPEVARDVLRLKIVKVLRKYIKQLKLN